MDVPGQIERAQRTGASLRVHTRGGEVLVARVLDWDGRELLYAVVTSSRPENYAVCDSTGFALEVDQIERAVVVEPRRERTAGRRRRR